MPAPNGGKGKRLPAVLLAVLAITQFGCGGPSSKVCLEQLRSKNSAERLRAVKALAKKGREADVIAPALAVALKDEDAFVRRDAAEALGSSAPAPSRPSPLWRRPRAIKTPKSANRPPRR